MTAPPPGIGRSSVRPKQGRWLPQHPQQYLDTESSSMRKERLAWAGKISSRVQRLSTQLESILIVHKLRPPPPKRVQHTRVGPSKDDPLIDATHFVHGNYGIVEACRIGQCLPAAQVLDVGKRRVVCGVALAIIPTRKSDGQV